MIPGLFLWLPTSVLQWNSTILNPINLIYSRGKTIVMEAWYAWEYGLKRKKIRLIYSIALENCNGGFIRIDTWTKISLCHSRVGSEGSTRWICVGLYRGQTSVEMTWSVECGACMSCIVKETYSIFVLALVLVDWWPRHSQLQVSTSRFARSHSHSQEPKWVYSAETRGVTAFLVFLPRSVVLLLLPPLSTHVPHPLWSFLSHKGQQVDKTDR